MTEELDMKKEQFMTALAFARNAVIESQDQEDLAYWLDGAKLLGAQLIREMKRED